jgi:LAO/AO transport system kinase
MLSLAHRHDGWIPPIVKTIATQGSGINELTAEIDRCYQFFQTGHLRVQKKREAARQRLLALLEERLVKTTIERVFPKDELSHIFEEIADRKQDPYSIVERIVSSLKFNGRSL